ncbi:hypothetical protein K3495_g1767 [Podosphaera aphanis]|nr:hypothetical protein K3495_g1767 [Podosphaera aphanis]
MVDIGAAEFFAGVRIVHVRSNRTLYLHQDAFINKIINKFGFAKSHSVDSPMLPAQHLIPSDNHATNSKISLYGSIVGSAMYAASQTRPDIAYTLSQLCRFLANPSYVHIDAARRLFQYLRGTTNLGLKYEQGPDLTLHRYTDLV